MGESIAEATTTQETVYLELRNLAMNLDDEHVVLHSTAITAEDINQVLGFIRYWVGSCEKRKELWKKMIWFCTSCGKDFVWVRKGLDTRPACCPACGHESVVVREV